MTPRVVVLAADLVGHDLGECVEAGLRGSGSARFGGSIRAHFLVVSERRGRRCHLTPASRNSPPLTDHDEVRSGDARSPASDAPCARAFGGAPPVVAVAALHVSICAFAEAAQRLALMVWGGSTTYSRERSIFSVDAAWCHTMPCAASSTSQRMNLPPCAANS